MIQYLKERLQYELPYSDIKRENLNKDLEDMIVAADKVAKQRFIKHPPRLCAVLVIFYRDTDEWLMPMILRPVHSRVHPGQMAFPGGKQEEEDTDLIATAIRETEEEIGVIVERQQVIGTLTPMYIPPSNSMVTPVLAYLERKPDYYPAPSEVAEVVNIPLSELQKTTNKGVKKVIMADGTYINLPSFTVHEKVIWGGSARMISEIIELMEEKEKGWLPPLP